jgi:hypothetical protein
MTLAGNVCYFIITRLADSLEEAERNDEIPIEPINVVRTLEWVRVMNSLRFIRG